MSTYIIAGEAGSPDLADCEFLGKKLVASTPSCHVHIIAKHSTEWDDFLKRTCSGYGFKEASSPIVFTVDGKLIGDKHAFKEHVLQTYSVRGELDKNMRTLVSEFDKASLENHRQKLADGPSVLETVREKLQEIVGNGGMRIADGFFEDQVDNGFEFFVHRSQILGPFTYDHFEAWDRDLDFVVVPELASEKSDDEMISHPELKITEEDMLEVDEESKYDEVMSQANDLERERKATEADKENRERENKEKEKEKSRLGSPVLSKEDTDPDSSLYRYELDDRNLRRFIDIFTSLKQVTEFQAESHPVEVPVPSSIKTLKIFSTSVVRDLPKDYMLALSPFPLIPREMIVFSGTMAEDGWLIRDSSMMQNWIKVINIPPQKPVYRDGDIIDPVIPKDPVFVKDISASSLKHRGFTYKSLDLDLQCSRNSSIRLNTINIMIRHLLTECDWEVWFKTVKEIAAVGYYQMLPYGEMK